MLTMKFLRAWKQSNDFDALRQQRLKQWSYIDGLAQHCSNSIANALELLQSCVKPSISLLTYLLAY